MRGTDVQQESLFSYSKVSDFVPPDHPLRCIRALTDVALESTGGALATSYSHRGRASMVPGRLLRTLILQILFSIRSERQLADHLRYNMPHRWFVGLSLDDKVWDATTFTKNRDRFIGGDVAKQLLEAVVEQAKAYRLLSSEHFSVDGSLIEAWASQASYRSKDDDCDPPNGPPDFRGDKRRRETHQSKTDADAALYKKAQGQEARLCCIGSVLTENSNGLVIDATVTRAHGRAEVDAALTMLDRRPGRKCLTVGADKNYHQQRFINGERKARMTPHVAKRRWSRIDGCTTRHAGYDQSINACHRDEAPFGWAKFGRPFKRTMLRGLARVESQAQRVFASYDRVRVARLCCRHEGVLKDRCACRARLAAKNAANRA